MTSLVHFVKNHLERQMGNSDVLFRGEGVIELRTVEDMGEGGVKKLGKSGDVLYGRPLTRLFNSGVPVGLTCLHKPWPRPQ